MTVNNIVVPKRSFTAALPVKEALEDLPIGLEALTPALPAQHRHKKWSHMPAQLSTACRIAQNEMVQQS